ncbi:zinc finger protein 436 isoform X1 [Tachysurus vachellii]|uniref:zinc finger protein 436 isoform X1 n=1 Tax=Tachysurus vachellii TaxID=175792 RepID=UPI00296B49DF|nr:zinc finger protein 436 isoform X1 [Tachysurus vachellii]XP_060741499.1 zinc finger protein 436 isoform X1 [Tachysurus vachellii]XP_060741500.1 zinc finger protein 436 isoform X1 [Tachysurus vachellii]XP_060741501.1 zinc finger protein 436 isoform X1 [Tachysurus vachellii]
MADSVKTFQAHLTAVMDSLVRASVCEITKLFEDTVNDYLVEISLNRKENEALKLRLRLTENKLRNERKYGLAWAASRRAAGLLGPDESGCAKKRKLESRGKQAKEWSGGVWEEGVGGVRDERRDERRDVCNTHPPTAGEGEEQEEERRHVSGERKEVATVKEEEDVYRCESVRLLQEALQMSKTESNTAQEDLDPVSTGPGSAVGDVWEQPGLSAEPTKSSDEMSGLETALKVEREREEAESVLTSPSNAVDRSDSVEFIGLDGLCSSQQDPAPSTHEASPAEIGPRSQGDDEGEESGQEVEDLLHFCPQCGGGFNSASELAEHVCPLAEERFQCSACGRAFSHAWSLKSHECVQAGEQPHRCELCGKRFTHSRSLERHQLVHTGERPHQCPQCGRSFSRLGNLERHQRIHTGERPYECGACGKRFSRIEYLKRHQQIHSGERGERNQTLSDTELKRNQCFSSA